MIERPSQSLTCGSRPRASTRIASRSAPVGASRPASSASRRAAPMAASCSAQRPSRYSGPKNPTSAGYMHSSS